MSSEERLTENDQARLISLDSTSHFEREGFSGDAYIPKEAEMGFTALQITVDGQHPRKRILKGNTRSYYVVEGEGQFTLNETTRSITKGDLVVIPEGNEYEYMGKMTLFEFNVSPRNGFRDKVIEKPEASKSPNPFARNPEGRPESDDPLDHHSANPERGAFQYALAMILGNGYTLTRLDVLDIMGHYGYNVSSGNAPLAGMQMNNPKTRIALASLSIELVREKYRNICVYRDGSLRVQDTDLVQTYSRIDERKDG